MSELHALIAAAGVAVMALGFVSAFLKNESSVGEPALAIAFGLALGPAAAGLIDLSALGDPYAILRETARFTIGVSVMTAALRVPTAWLRANWRALALFLGVGMPAMWLAGGAVAAVAFGFALWPALLLGAICAPTDPVLAGSIVDGDIAKARVPADPRHLLSAEAGANDGLGLPFVVLALMMVQGQALWPEFAVDTLLRAVLGGVAFGLAIGLAAALIGRWANRWGLAEATDEAPTTLALALIAVGGGHALGLDGILSSFVAGLVFRALRSTREDDEQLRYETSTKRLFELPVFVLLGLALPLEAWRGLGWPLLGFALALFLLRRPPWIYALGRMTRAARRPAASAYLGWFGPIGIAALFYSLHVEDALGEGKWFEIVSFVIVLSALVHGFSAEPVARRFPRRDRG